MVRVSDRNGIPSTTMLFCFSRTNACVCVATGLLYLTLPKFMVGQSSPWTSYMTKYLAPSLGLVCPVVKPHAQGGTYSFPLLCLHQSTNRDGYLCFFAGPSRIFRMMNSWTVLFSAILLPVLIGLGPPTCPKLGAMVL